MSDNARFVKALRDLADFMAAHPDLDFPAYTTLNIWAYNKEELQAALKGKGYWDKIEEPTWMVFRKKFGPINFDVNITRTEVCERVVVGLETIPAIPARPAEPERIVEKVEWRCKPIFGDDVVDAEVIDES